MTVNPGTLFRTMNGNLGIVLQPIIVDARTDQTGYMVYVIRRSPTEAALVFHPTSWFEGASTVVE